MTEGRTFKLPQVKTGKNQPFIVATMPSSFTSLHGQSMPLSPNMELTIVHDQTFVR